MEDMFKMHKIVNKIIHKIERLGNYQLNQLKIHGINYKNTFEYQRIELYIAFEEFKLSILKELFL